MNPTTNQCFYFHLSRTSRQKRNSVGKEIKKIGKLSHKKFRTSPTPPPTRDPPVTGPSRHMHGWMAVLRVGVERRGEREMIIALSRRQEKDLDRHVVKNNPRQTTGRQNHPSVRSRVKHAHQYVYQCLQVSLSDRSTPTEVW